MQKKFTEWIRHFMQNPYLNFDYATYVDKHKVKEVVSPVVNVAKEIAYFTTPEQIDVFDFKRIPPEFIIKATHGCKWFIEKRNNQPFDVNAAKAKMKEWLGKKYHTEAELQYDMLEPGVLIEQLLPNPLSEYKLWYIHGELQFIEARDLSSAKRAHYSKNWIRLPFVRKNQPQYFEAPKPNNLSELISIGDKLVKLINDPPFVRIDLYSKKSCCTKKDVVYFSEYTFTPASGCNPFTPDEYEIKFGDLI